MCTDSWILRSYGSTPLFPSRTRPTDCLYLGLRRILCLISPPGTFSNVGNALPTITMRIVIMGRMKDDFGYEANDNFLPRGPTVPSYTFGNATSTPLTSEQQVRTKIASSAFVNLNYAIKNLRHNQNVNNKHGIAYVFLKGKEPKFRCSAPKEVAPIIDAVRKWNEQLLPKYDAIVWVDAGYKRYTNHREPVASRPLMTHMPTCTFLAKGSIGMGIEHGVEKEDAGSKLRPVENSTEIIRKNGHPAYGSIYARNSGVPAPNHYKVENIRFNKHVQRNPPAYSMSGWPEDKKQEADNAMPKLGLYDENGDLKEYDEKVESSMGIQVVSRPLQKEGRSSPRPVFGMAPRFPNGQKDRNKRQALVRHRNEIKLVHYTDESPGPRYLPVPSLWGLENNVGSKSKPETLTTGFSFGTSPRFNISKK